ncbi:hypothetical protein [Streptomyces barkulensis]|uniref:hypothetical protein n=1 Tax=Streptomyces barkulensis TaxID=1257026 RepID=UPI00117F853B|nr:hypothetical protein [Streptomyces barkulensis]
MARRVTAPLAACGLLAALAACSGDSGGKTDASSPEPGTERIRTVVQLSELCSEIGDGHPGAARYSGDGPHRTAVFRSGYRTDKDVMTGTVLQEHVSFDGLPDLSKTTPVSEIELLACGKGERGEERERDCEYAESGRLDPRESYPMYSQTFTYTVYELRTGRVVDTITRTPQPQCPSKIGYRQGGSGTPDKVYAQISDREASQVLKPVVEGPAR